MKKIIVSLLIVSMAISLFGGCGAATKPAEASTAATVTPSAAPATESAKKDDVLTIGFSWSHKNDTLFYGMADTLKASMDKTCADHGYSKVEWVDAIADDNAETQANDIQDFINRKVDLICVYAFDSIAIGSSIEAAQAAGIPIVLYDRAADKSVTQPDLFVGLDTTAQAYDAGKAFFQKMKDAGEKPTKILSIIGSLSDQNALNRIEGFKKAAGEFGYTIDVEIPSNWNSDEALANFTTAWQSNPNSNCVLIASDFIITSVQSVLEANNAWIPNGQKGHVWICSQDGFPVGLQYIRDGYMDVSGVYNLEGMAGLFSDNVYNLLDGKTLENKSQTVGASLMVKENVDTENWWAKAYENK